MRCKIGFIGLGIMGKPMAARLLANGVQLMVYDIDPHASSNIVNHGAQNSTLQEIGEQCRIVFLMLPNGPIVKSLIFCPNGLASYLKVGNLICDMSSVTPNEAKECSDRLKSIGCSYIDAPVSGGEIKAISGELTFMVGATETDFNIILPFLKMMGSGQHHMGLPGSGSAAKLCNQIMTTANITAVCEAFALAKYLGLDLKQLFEAVRIGSAGSAMLENRIEKIINHNYIPGAKVSTHLKDINNVICVTEQLQISLPISKVLQQIIEKHASLGYADSDSSSLFEFFFSNSKSECN